MLHKSITFGPRALYFSAENKTLFYNIVIGCISGFALESFWRRKICFEAFSETHESKYILEKASKYILEKA